MHIFKPTVVNVIGSILLIFLFVPFVQLLEPDCQGFGTHYIRGDGPQSIVCYDGVRSLFSYILLITPGTVWSDDHIELFQWKLFVAPNYPFLFIGSIGVYITVCSLIQLKRLITPS